MSTTYMLNIPGKDAGMSVAWAALALRGDTIDVDPGDHCMAPVRAYGPLEEVTAMMDLIVEAASTSKWPITGATVTPFNDVGYTHFVGGNDLFDYKEAA